MPDKELSKKIISDLINEDGRGLAVIAKEIGISRQRLTNYKNGERFPDADFIQKWQKTFGENLMDLMDKATDKATNVSHETKNSTPAMKSTDSKETAIRGHVYTELIEQNSDYKLMPTMILTDYSIIPKRILDGHDKEIARQEILISKYEGLINRLEKEIESLRSQLTPKNAQ
jgi:transcriptional regulator with XRE-family HTH domain